MKKGNISNMLNSWEIANVSGGVHTGCYDCYYYSNGRGWIYYGSYYGEIRNGVYYNGCDICTKELHPRYVSCSSRPCY